MTDRRRGSIPRDMQDQQASNDRQGHAQEIGRSTGDRHKAEGVGRKAADKEEDRSAEDAAGKTDRPSPGEPPD
ncbi:hypothetical protein [Streptomyces sp. NPDC053079]|uniref:hypothetical protein n=1 Tax=Streptomyces sp. NPDC053079 TaxID=3365697 RepID=UPI0037D511B9